MVFHASMSHGPERAVKNRGRGQSSRDMLNNNAISLRLHQRYIHLVWNYILLKFHSQNVVGGFINDHVSGTSHI